MLKDSGIDMEKKEGLNLILLELCQLSFRPFRLILCTLR